MEKRERLSFVFLPLFRFFFKKETLHFGFPQNPNFRVSKTDVVMRSKAWIELHDNDGTGMQVYHRHSHSI